MTEEQKFLNKSKVNLVSGIIIGERIFKLPKGSKYLTLHVQKGKLIGFTVHYLPNKISVDMEVNL